MASKWSITNLMADVEAYIDSTDLPETLKPQDGHDYYFPTNVRDLRQEELGSLNLMITAWYSHGLWLLGREDAELSAFRTVYNQKLLAEVAARRSTAHSKATVEEIKSVIVMEDEESDFARLAQSLLFREAKVTRLKAQTDIYSEQLSKLSREQSRRESEMKRLG